MLNANLLRAAMAKSGYTQKQLADCIGISPNTFSSRMVGKSKFDTDEADKICDTLNILSNDEKVAIFLSSISQKREKESEEDKIE